MFFSNQAFLPFSQFASQDFSAVALAPFHLANGSSLQKASCCSMQTLNVTDEKHYK